MISCSDEHKLITGRLANAALLKRLEHIVALGPFANAVGELKAPNTYRALQEPCLVSTAMIHSSWSLVLLYHILVILR